MGIRRIASRSLLVLLFAFTLGGCATVQTAPSGMPVSVVASTLGDPIPGKTYFLYHDQDQPLTVEQNLFERLLRPQLLTKGLIEATTMEEATYVIVASYGDKTIQSYRTVPTWGVTGQSSRTTATVSPLGGSVTSNTYTTPTYGITGFQRIPDTATMRMMIIHAYDRAKLSESGALEEQWKVAAAFESAPWGTTEPPYSVMLRAVTPVIGTTISEVSTVHVPRLDAVQPGETGSELRFLGTKIWGN